MMKRFIVLICVLVSNYVSAQDWGSLDSMLDDKGLTIATFKSTRLINQHTAEVLGKHTLDFRIQHRFGPANSGGSELWGLDGPANIKLALEYSFDGRFMFGIGRSSLEKLFDGFLKYKLLRQADAGMPITMTLFAGAYYTSADVTINEIDVYDNTTSRLSYCYELLLARKFSNRFSFQVSPWFVHYNQVERTADKNDVYGLAGMFRFKFTKRSAITAEYSYRLNDYYVESDTRKYYDSFSVGYELETGGHVFQIFFANSFGMAESQFFAHTINKWEDGGIRLGFNISRVFAL
jgi:hypothetical protein